MWQLFAAVYILFCKFAFENKNWFFVKKILAGLFNKYIITALAFVALMLFIDQNDWFTQRERQRDLDKANENVEFLRSEIATMNDELHKLKSDSATLERYARERYYEKRDQEDVYVIVPDTGASPSVEKNK